MKTKKDEGSIEFDAAELERGREEYNVGSELARSAVIYLEQEDPARPFREKVVCAVNVGDFELRFPADSNAPEAVVSDGRSLRRKMWDEAVQALVRITTGNGLNPKFVRNDKNSCRLTLKQDPVSTLQDMPDEFFCLELFYCSEFELERRKLEYVRALDSLDEQIRECRAKIHSWKTSPKRKGDLEKKLQGFTRDRAFVVATTPDPREMDSGLIFKIELITLKEYGVTKRKLKTILGQYLAELSRIAAEHGTALPPSVTGVLKQVA